MPKQKKKRNKINKTRFDLSTFYAEIKAFKHPYRFFKALGSKIKTQSFKIKHFQGLESKILFPSTFKHFAKHLRTLITFCKLKTKKCISIEAMIDSLKRNTILPC